MQPPFAKRSLSQVRHPMKIPKHRQGTDLSELGPSVVCVERILLNLRVLTTE